MKDETLQITEYLVFIKDELLTCDFSSGLMDERQTCTFSMSLLQKQPYGLGSRDEIKVQVVAVYGDLGESEKSAAGGGSFMPIYSSFSDALSYREANPGMT